MTTVKTEQLQLGPGLVFKAVREFGFPTLVAAVLGVVLWFSHRDASAERKELWAKHAEERALLAREIGAKLDKLKREVRREHGCKVNVAEDDE